MTNIYQLFGIDFDLDAPADDCRPRQEPNDPLKTKTGFVRRVTTLLVLFCFACTVVPAFGQHACIRGLGAENHQVWWTGGDNSKFLINFSGDEPGLSLDGSQTRSIETTAVYTTAGAELLLYTDGDVVFDGRSHEEIGKGVGGNPSSTEAALIVPAPDGDPTNDFLVFGNMANTKGPIQYTYVDVAEGTIGQIIAVDGGRLFGEALGTVPHSNGNDFWILALTHKDPALHAYLITAGGVASTPVRTELPDLPEGATSNRGSIVYHPPTGRLALTIATHVSPRSLLYTAAFNELTGAANDFRRFEVGGYGVAFSPGGSKLYYAKSYNGPLFQLDQGSGEVHQIATGRWGMPRLGPDGKLYVVAYRSKAIGVLANPDAAYDQLNWDTQGLLLPEGATAAYSLPNQVFAPCVVNYPDEKITPTIGDGYVTVVWAENDVDTQDSVAIVLDMSGSMWGQIAGIPKYEIAREIVATTVGELPETTHVGVRVYGHRTGNCLDTELLAPLSTGDRGSLTQQIGSLVPNNGKTPIAHSLQQVLSDLRDTPGNKSIVLVSDGIETCDGDPVEAAKALCESGLQMRVHTVGFDIEGESDAATELEAVSAAGCGRYFAAADPVELREALRAASSTSLRLSNMVTGETYAGMVGSGPITLPPGSYNLIVDWDSPIGLGSVTVKAGATVIVNLTRSSQALERK